LLDGAPLQLIKSAVEFWCGAKKSSPSKSNTIIEEHGGSDDKRSRTTRSGLTISSAVFSFAARGMNKRIDNPKFTPNRL